MTTGPLHRLVWEGAGWGVVLASDALVLYSIVWLVHPRVGRRSIRSEAARFANCVIAAIAVPIVLFHLGIDVLHGKGQLFTLPLFFIFLVSEFLTDHPGVPGFLSIEHPAGVGIYWLFLYAVGRWRLQSENEKRMIACNIALSTASAKLPGDDPPQLPRF